MRCKKSGEPLVEPSKEKLTEIRITFVGARRAGNAPPRGGGLAGVAGRGATRPLRGGYAKGPRRGVPSGVAEVWGRSSGGGGDRGARWFSAVQD